VEKKRQGGSHSKGIPGGAKKEKYKRGGPSNESLKKEGSEVSGGGKK